MSMHLDQAAPAVRVWQEYKDAVLFWTDATLVELSQEFWDSIPSDSKVLTRWEERD